MQPTPKSTPRSISRRRFLGQTAIASAGLFAACSSPRTARIWGAHEKLNIGVIGVAGQGGYSIDNLQDQNIVALCDVDARNLAKVATRFPAAKTYHDFRRLIDQSDLDAIVVATPDHTHAVCAVAALRSGRHLYCEKPLARTVSETRIITDTAHRMNRVTQIGTQIHAGDNYRRVVELVQSGAVGTIKEVHVWVNGSYGGKKRPTDTPPVPDWLNYEQWLGPVEYRPYSPDYVPFNWRHFWAFGGGTLADFGCHYMDLPFWALGLKYPTSVEAEGPAPDSESPSTWIKVRYQFPAGEVAGRPRPALPLTWYHGGKYPGHILSPEQYKKWGSGVLFVGEKGMIVSDYSRRALWPEKEYEGFVAPAQTIAKSIGHHKEWVEAIKGRGTTTCPFSYSGPLTETALLGNAAFRAGKKLEWDGARLKVRNGSEAQPFIQHHYRQGWSL